MNIFPFPDRSLLIEELRRDIMFDRIPECDRQPICEEAWELGYRTACETIERYGWLPMPEIAAQNNLTIERRELDKVSGKTRFFGEYYSQERKIVLYMGSIRKWAQQNELEIETAVEVILSHEFFHFLEDMSARELSKRYTVPQIRVGKWVILRAGIQALSEIGAHAFARTVFDLSGRSV